MKCFRYTLAALAVFSVTLSTVACSSKKSSSPVTTTTGTYYTSNSLCYRTSDNVQVDTSYCTSSTTYYTSNGYCYRTSDGEKVDTSYCATSTGYTSSNGYCYRSSDGAQVDLSYCATNTVACAGWYIWVSYYGYSQQVYCDGLAGNGNCSGYGLYRADTGAYVMCK